MVTAHTQYCHLLAFQCNDWLRSWEQIPPIHVYNLHEGIVWILQQPCCECLSRHRYGYNTQLSHDSHEGKKKKGWCEHEPGKSTSHQTLMCTCVCLQNTPSWSWKLLPTRYAPDTQPNSLSHKSFPLHISSKLRHKKQNICIEGGPPLWHYQTSICPLLWVHFPAWLATNHKLPRHV